MDVLKPDLLWIDGKCYRIPMCIKSETVDEHDRPYYDEDANCMGGDSDNSDDFDVDMTEIGRYRTVFHIPRSYFASIIGPQGSVRRRSEDETRTQIRIPSKAQTGDIVITGGDEKGVVMARRRINLIVAASRQKQPFTHFLSIPMTGKVIRNSFLQFKEEVCNLCTNHRIDPSIFQTPEKMHLTLGTMALGDDDERSTAIKMLHEYKETNIDPLLQSKPLKLRMVGVEYMNDDPNEVDILYGKVQVLDGTGVLQQLADNLVEYFTKKGLMVNKFGQVKLHVTLMNTLFRDNKDEASEQDRSGGKRRPRETFDATDILKVFQDYDFGEIHADAIHLSQRFTTAPDGYYQSSTIVKL